MWKDLYERLLEIIYPDRCVGCASQGELFCKQCLSKVHPLASQECPYCSKPSSLGEVCSPCRKNTERYLDFVLVGCSYHHNPIVSLLIKTMKYKNIKRSLRYLPRCIWHPMMRLMHAWGYDEPIVVPVPLHKKRQKERGFNQSSLIARHIASITGFVCEEDILERIRYTIPQATLKREERLTNMKDAFALCREPPREKNYVLIDDVATTLSTLEACAKVLKEAGCSRVGAFVIARK